MSHGPLPASTWETCIPRRSFLRLLQPKDRATFCLKHRPPRVLLQQFTYGVVSEGGFCVKFAEVPRKLRGNLQNMRFIASGKALTPQSLHLSISLLFIVFQFPLSFCAFFLSFPRILGVPQREKPLHFSGFPLLFFPKTARVGGSGQGAESLRKGLAPPQIPRKHPSCPSPLLLKDHPPGIFTQPKSPTPYMSKVGPIWHFSVLCLLALGDTIPKP